MLRRAARLAVALLAVALGAGATLPGRAAATAPEQPGQAAPMAAHGSLASCAPASQVRADVADHILPFWAATLDTDSGGFRVPAPPGSRALAGKQLVTQARLVWSFSRAHRAGLDGGTGRDLRAAASGYRFLVDHFRDPVRGGYAWMTDDRGTLLDSRKILYGQAFVLYALTEYYRASGDVGALAEAYRLFSDLNTRARDRRHGGWFGHYEADWQPILAPRGYLHVEETGLKGANTHLHLMEAVAELAALVPAPEVKAALAHLLAINATIFFPSPGGAVTYADPDWSTPELPWDPRAWALRVRQLVRGPLVSYGHNVEFAWLADHVERTLGRPRDPARFDRFLTHALQRGANAGHGGLADGGYGDATAHRTDRLWWPQAELLTALTVALEGRTSAEYDRARLRLVQWLLQHQADPVTRVWRESVADDGRVRSGVLAHHWKETYHDLRALVAYLASCGQVRFDRAATPVV